LPRSTSSSGIETGFLLAITLVNLRGTRKSAGGRAEKPSALTPAFMFSAVSMFRAMSSIYPRAQKQKSFGSFLQKRTS
jgi:hypothetical protein